MTEMFVGFGTLLLFAMLFRTLVTMLVGVCPFCNGVFRGMLFCTLFCAFWLICACVRG